LGVTIDIPVAGQTAKVRVNGDTQTICAEGEASRGGSVYPNKIWAKVYQSNPIPIPINPGPDATQGTISSNDQWNFTGAQEIPGATSSDAAPYPENWLVVWAEYDDPFPSYDSTITTFYGQSSTQTDCDS
jgi:hypothetical protein